MVMNKKGQFIFVGIMVAIMVFITAIVLIEPLKDGIEIGRDADHLNCGNESNTVGTKATCILVDFWLFYFVGVCIAGGISFITVKKIQQQIG
jgi:hypothetical protein